jgi:threonine dehydrogenase-like Zn-dependent dehydrogenase
MKCKTVRYPKAGGAEIVEVPINDPQHGEIQFRALACGICAWDVYVYGHALEYEAGPGHEGLGQVIKVGPGVTGFKEGDWITGHGMGFTEIANIAAKDSLIVPHDAKSRPQDWIIEPVACVVTGIDHCALKAGDRIALIGCGFMGLMFVQGLSHCLLDRFVVIDVDPARLALAKQFGAHEVIDGKTFDPASMKGQFDTVVDATGAAPAVRTATTLVRRGGRINLFGWNHGDVSVPGDTWHGNGLTIVNSAPNSAIRDPWPIAVRMLQRGYIDLKPIVSHVVPLEDYPALLDKAANKKDGYIKGVVTLNEPV